jgi:hypothetical protein
LSREALLNESLDWLQLLYSAKQRQLARDAQLAVHVASAGAEAPYSAGKYAKTLLKNLAREEQRCR